MAKRQNIMGEMQHSITHQSMDGDVGCGGVRTWSSDMCATDAQTGFTRFHCTTGLLLRDGPVVHTLSGSDCFRLTAQPVFAHFCS